LAIVAPLWFSPTKPPTPTLPLPLTAPVAWESVIVPEPKLSPTSPPIVPLPEPVTAPVA
jgi:hypothetical protein